ncbi:MAG: hypothetical protein ACXVMI_14805 [Flavisolibacter sp.]
MRTILFLCFAFLSQQLFAQEKTFSGFYITETHDTVSGFFPKYNQWSKNPDKVDFLPAGTSKPKQLTPSNCLKFVINNYDEYDAYIGKRLINPIDDNEAVENRSSFDYNYRDSVTVVFLRLAIATPRCSLFVLNDHIRTNLFYQLPGQPLQELKYKKYFDENNLHELAEYRQQLNNLFPNEIEEKKLSTELEQLAYSEDAVSEFLQKLFSVKKKRTSKRNTAAGWVINAGVSANSLKVTGDDFLETRVGYANSYAPYLSVGYFLPFQRNFSRYFVYSQVRFYQYENTGNEVSATLSRKVTFQSDFVIVPHLNLGVNVINKENLRVFLYAGAGIMILMNNKETIDLYRLSDNSLYSSNAYNLSPATAAANLSLGLAMKNRFELLLTYNLPTDISNFPAYSAKQSSLQAGLGYKFGRH